MKYLMLFLIPLKCFGAEVIYSKIVSLQPETPPMVALKLALSIKKYSTIYKTDPLISIAIAMQESSLKFKNRTVKLKNGTKVITDYGMFQIHRKTADDFKLDKTRLTYDIDYQVEQHIKILKVKIKNCINKGVPKNKAWACYHSYTPKLREDYFKKVVRYVK